MATQAPQHRIVYVPWDAKEALVWRNMAPMVHKTLDERFQFDIAEPGISAEGAGRETFRRRLLSPVRTRARRLQWLLRREPFRVKDDDSDPEITLIAHGRACHAVKQYLLSLLKETEDGWRDRRRVRQAIFVCPARLRFTHVLLWVTIATAFLAVVSETLRHVYPGADSIFSSVTTALGIIFGVLSLLLAILLSGEARSFLGWQDTFDNDKLDKDFDQFIVNGSKGRADTWPIPSQTLQLDHLSASIDNADAVSAAIRRIKGHKNVYEVELVNIQVEIGPVGPDQLPARAREHGSSDNRAHRTETVTFSDGDNTKDTDLPPCELKYRTNGYLELDAEPDSNTNMWTGQEQGEWRAKSQRFIYRFRPTAGSTRSLRMTIYGGFNRGDRSAHSHIDVYKYIARAEQEVDLRQYLAAGWTISSPVQVYYLPPRPPYIENADRIFPDEICDCFTSGRRLADGRALQVTQPEPGVFRWTVYSVRNGGMIGFLYDVTPPEGKP